MKCKNCKVIVDRKFEFAIRSNSCPACGKHIMGSEELVIYNNLKKLLLDNFKDADIEKIASLIVASFELKQISKEKLQISTEEGIISVSEDESVDEDKESKEKQMSEAKTLLQKMRDDALESALNNQGYDFNDAGVLMDDGAEMHEITNKEKQIQTQNTVTSGTGGQGSFSRG